MAPLKNDIGAGKRKLGQKQKRKKKEKYRLKRLLKRTTENKSISNDQLQYFLRVEKNLDQFKNSTNLNTQDDYFTTDYANDNDYSNNQVDNPEQDDYQMEKELFFKNICEQLTVGTSDLLKNSIITKVVQKFICQFNLLDELEIFVRLILTPEIATELFDHPFGSHIIESIFAQYNNLCSSNVDFVKLPQLKLLIDTIFTAEVDCFGIYSCHIFSSMIELIGRIKMSSNLIKSRLSRNSFYVLMNDSNTKNSSEAILSCNTDKILNNYFSVVWSKKNIAFDDYCPSTNYLKQCCQLVEGHLKKSSNVMTEYVVVPTLCLICALFNHNKFVFNEFFASICQKIKFDSIFDEVNSYLIQLLLVLANIHYSTKQPDVIYDIVNKNLFSKDSLTKVISHNSANHVLQAYISSILSKDQAVFAHSHLCSYVELILNSKNFQLIVKLLELVKNFDLEKETLVEKLIDAFNFQDNKKASVQLLIHFLMLEPVNSSNSNLASINQITINYHGSIIVKNLLNISDIFVVSFTKLQPDQLMFLAKDKYGIIVFKEFFESKNVSDEFKVQICSKLVKSKNLISNLSLHKIGSFCLEDIFNNCPIESKRQIAEQIFKSRDVVTNNRFGTIIFKKFRIAQFEANYDRWIKIFSGQ